jgi:hypothetical protein
MNWKIGGRFAEHASTGLRLEFGQHGEVVNVAMFPSGISTRDLPALIEGAEKEYCLMRSGLSMSRIGTTEVRVLPVGVNAARPKLSLKKAGN